MSFSPDATTSPQLGGNGGGNAIGALPAASGFYVYDLSDKWKVGLGMFNYFGLAEKYDDNWVGRYYVQNSALLGMTLMPAASFKATDWLSIGAGLNAMYGYLKTDMAVNNGSPVDGQLSLKDETWGFGANVGVLIEPREGTRFGVTYLSPLTLDFKDHPQHQRLRGQPRQPADPAAVGSRHDRAAIGHGRFLPGTLSQMGRDGRLRLATMEPVRRSPGGR